MGDDLLVEVGRQILADLARSTVMGTLPAESASLNRNRAPRLALAPSGEDFVQRLRGIRRLITVKEFGALAHLHPESVYRRIKAGMPAEHDGRNLRIYPPKVADWLIDIRENRRRQMKPVKRPIDPKLDHAGCARKEMGES